MSALDQLEQAAQGQVDLAEVKALADEQVKLEGKLDAASKVVADLKKELNAVQLDKLPAAMIAAGISDFTMSDTGQKIILKEDMTISVPKKRKGEIIEKVRDMGHGDLISNVLTIPVDKGKDNMVGELMSKVEELGLSATRTEDVNSASLKKVLNDRRKSGENDDLSFFGAYVVTKTQVKG